MKAPIFAVLLSLASSAPVLAGTFVYVSNAEDGDIGMYTLQADGSLQPGQRFKAAKLGMPMAVSPDKRFLIAAVRSKPFQAYSYSIDKSSGALNLVGTGTHCSGPRVQSCSGGGARSDYAAAAGASDHPQFRGIA